MHDVTQQPHRGSQQRYSEQSRWLVTFSAMDNADSAPWIWHDSHSYGWIDVPSKLRCHWMKQPHPIHHLQKCSMYIHSLFGLPGNSFWWVSNFILQDSFLIVFHEVGSGRRIWLVLSSEKSTQTPKDITWSLFQILFGPQSHEGQISPTTTGSLLFLLSLDRVSYLRPA